jgi:hypothetical protein
MGRHKKERTIFAGLDVTEKKIRKTNKLSKTIMGGSEPEWIMPSKLLSEKESQLEFQLQLGKHCNWYNVYSSEAKKKKYLIEYTEKFFPEIVYVIEKMPEKSFVCGKPHVMAMVARCILRGAPLQYDAFDNQGRLNQFIQDIVKLDEKEKNQPERKRARDTKVVEYISIVENIIDYYLKQKGKIKFSDPCMVDTILKRGASKAQLTQINYHFSNFVSNLVALNSGKKDEYLEEAYSNQPLETWLKLCDWLTGEPNKELLASIKKQRKPRRKKVKTAAQLLKLFVYQKSDEELKFNSIEPEHIIDSTQLWVFNTKTRKLGVYYSQEGKTLSVSRKSIINYDEKISIQKKIRKPKEIVPQILTAGKVALKHVMEKIRAVESPIKSRINETVLLLRALK